MKENWRSEIILKYKLLKKKLREAQLSVSNDEKLSKERMNSSLKVLYELY